MSSKVSNSQVDEMYQRALAAGALGGKLTGAGGGGFLLLFVEPQHQERVRDELSQLIYVPFKFEQSGSQIIFYDHQPDYASEERRQARQEILAFRELNAIGGSAAAAQLTSRG
jgi:D-glycero-alpha-D-manno-heptose-7-phosphate kinase